MNKTEEFVENIYLEVQKYVNGIFDNNETYVSEKIKELNLSKHDEEKFKNIVSAAFDDIMITLLYGFDGEANINGKQQCYKIFDEENNLIYGSGELEVEAYEYFHAFKYESKNKDFDIIGIMKYTNKENCEDNKNLKVKIFENNIPVEIYFIKRKIIFCNEIVRVGLRLNSFETTMGMIKNDIDKIKYDKGFEIIKDNKVVGEVKIMEIMNEKLFEI
jgi:hypothetical protein